jgi:hypothetical protein
MWPAHGLLAAMRSAGSRRSCLTLASALRRGEQQAVQASASAASIRLARLSIFQES